MKQLHIHLQPLGKWSKVFIRLAVFLILTVTLVLLGSYLCTYSQSRARANILYPPLVEYPIAAVALTAGGVLLIEAVERDGER